MCSSPLADTHFRAVGAPRLVDANQTVIDMLQRLMKRGGKGDWEFCSSSSECDNGCCSSQYSNDGKTKCTPGG